MSDKATAMESGRQQPAALVRRALGFDTNRRGTLLYSMLLAFLSLAWLFVGLRAYVKMRLVKKVTPDDYLMFVTALVYTAYAAIAAWGIQDGDTGQISSKLTLDGTSNALEAWFLCELIYPPLSALARTSIAVFLLRISAVRTHTYIIYANMAVIWVLSIVYSFLMLFQCSPPSHFWKMVTGHPGRCMDARVVPTATIVHSAVAATSDFVLALLPVAILWNVQLNKRTKFTVASLLSLGFFAGVALLVRIPFVKFLSVSTEFLYETIDVAIWSAMEPSLGIIAGCAATLRPLFKAWGLDPPAASNHYDTPSRRRSSGPAVWSRRTRGKAVSNRSDIELIDTQTSMWDVEQGHVDRGVHVEASVEMTSENKGGHGTSSGSGNGSGNDSETQVPSTARREGTTLMLRGPEPLEFSLPRPI